MLDKIALDLIPTLENGRRLLKDMVTQAARAEAGRDRLDFGVYLAVVRAPLLFRFKLASVEARCLGNEFEREAQVLRHVGDILDAIEQPRRTDLLRL